jgi:hypothetical protein
MTIDTTPLDDEWRYELADIMTEFAERLVQTVTREKTSSERKAHLAAIAKITGRWLDGEISTAQKREQIAQENAFWYGREKRSSATGELLTAATKGSGTARPVPAAAVPGPDPDPWGEDDDDDEGLRWDQK